MDRSRNSARRAGERQERSRGVFYIADDNSNCIFLLFLRTILQEQTSYLVTCLKQLRKCEAYFKIKTGITYKY